MTNFVWWDDINWIQRREFWYTEVTNIEIMVLKTLLKIVVIQLSLVISRSGAQFTNQWAVEVEGGLAEADLVASETGCINEGNER